MIEQAALNSGDQKRDIQEYLAGDINDPRRTGPLRDSWIIDPPSLPLSPIDKTDVGPSDLLTHGISRDSQMRSRMPTFSPMQSEKSSLMLPVVPTIQELEEDTIVTDDEEVKVSSPLAMAGNEMVSS